MRDNKQLVLSMWAAFDRQDFAAAASLLSDDFVCEWPQSGEIIRGRTNFITVNARYPGEWRIRILNAIVCGDEVVTEAEATWGEKLVWAVSFFRVRDGQIVHLREFWPEPYPPQDWRSAWVERT
jgi:ketosteroid isomerase-like protein